MAKRKVFSIGSSLSDGLEQTIAAAHNYSNELRVDVIPLHKIEIDPDNPRDLIITPRDLFDGLQPSDPAYDQKLQEKESLQSLANSIADQGVINPILVYENNHSYRIIAGERRTLASIIAGKSDIQAKIIDGRPSELKVRILQWIENIERSDLTLMERLDNLQMILSAYAAENKIQIQEIRITDISRIIGCVKSHAINLKAVLFAAPDIKELIADNKIRSLEKAAILTMIESPALRKQAITDCLNGASFKKIKAYLDQDKKGQSATDHVPVIAKIQNVNSINFGYTSKPLVAKTIIESVINHLSLDELNINEFRFDNPQSISKAFKKLISHLESVYE